jgi:RNA polymerase sigma-70 factor, ECF subfamily
VSATPLQTAGNADSALGVSQPPVVSDPVAEVIERLWKQTEALRFGFTPLQFAAMLQELGAVRRWGNTAEAAATVAERIHFLESLKIDDLVIARACAAGDEVAWETFLVRYREVLYSAAYAITRQDSLGRELADSLYADLYGTTERDGVRCSRFNSYTGRGSLAGWLRSVLAQRFVDHYRTARREVSLGEQEAERLPAPFEIDAGANERRRTTLAAAVSAVLAGMPAEDRFLLASYYLDDRTLLQIAQVVGVHESTVSRKLERLTRALRKELMRQLHRAGMSRAAAEESLGVDVRDIEVNVKELLQAGADSSFHRKDGAETE